MFISPFCCLESSTLYTCIAVQTSQHFGYMLCSSWGRKVQHTHTTHRHTHAHTQRERQRQRETETERDRETQRERQTERETERERERERQTDRQTDRQRGYSNSGRSAIISSDNQISRTRKNPSENVNWTGIYFVGVSLLGLQYLQCQLLSAGGATETVTNTVQSCSADAACTGGTTLVHTVVKAQ